MCIELNANFWQLEKSLPLSGGVVKKSKQKQSR